MTPSNQKFGYFFAAFFCLAFIYLHYKNQIFFSQITLILSILIGLITLIRPMLLSYPNQLWFKLGIFLGRIVSPIVLGVIFYILISPISIYLRIIKRDELRLKKNRGNTYWIERENPGPTPDSFRNQF